MWLITRDGFFSVVEQRDTNETIVLVRGRVKEHLQAMLAAIDEDQKIVDMPSADYRFRVSLPRDAWKDYLLFAGDDIDYDSHFKEVVRDAQPSKTAEPFYRAMLSIWTSLASIQPTPPYGVRPGRRRRV